ncbi:hypothetical protein F5050DRAFT_1549451, partial [Lentinula boryana]
GKSSVTRSVVELFAREGKLAASFFFWREDPTRNNVRHLISSLASQIANAYRIAESSNEWQRSNLIILEASLEDQF